MAISSSRAHAYTRGEKRGAVYTSVFYDDGEEREREREREHKGYRVKLSSLFMRDTAAAALRRLSFKFSPLDYMALDYFLVLVCMG